MHAGVRPLRETSYSTVPRYRADVYRSAPTYSEQGRSQGQYSPNFHVHAVLTVRPRPQKLMQTFPSYLQYGSNFHSVFPFSFGRVFKCSGIQ